MKDFLLDVADLALTGAIWVLVAVIGYEVVVALAAIIGRLE